MAAATIEACAEHRDDLDNVLRQFFLETPRLAFIDNDDLDVLDLA
jgi:hypothetical protein